jgi:hypothetical protein
MYTDIINTVHLVNCFFYPLIVVCRNLRLSKDFRFYVCFNPIQSHFEMAVFIVRRNSGFQGKGAIS